MSRKMNKIDNERSTGYRIRQHRLRLGYSQDNLAQMLHVTRSKIGQWEQNKQLPDVPSLKALAILFSCDIAYLLCEIDTEKIGGQMIERYTGLSTAAANTIIRLNNELSTGLLEQVIMSPFFLRSLEALDGAISVGNYGMSKDDRLAVAQMHESDKRLMNPFIRKMLSIMHIAEDSGDYDKMIHLLAEHTNSETYILTKEEYSEYQLQQSGHEFRRCIDAIRNSTIENKKEGE